MKSLFFLIVLAGATAMGQQSPHGPITIPCEACHSTNSWSFRSDATFNHATTGFALQGQHAAVPCRSCHEKLVFAKQGTDCASCHVDIHRQELGPNCLRCHTMESWVIADMRQEHQQSRFPLLGAHALADCDGCHTRSSEHRYAGTPLTCISCHKREFDATTAPSHVASGFPVECIQCHKPEALTWGGGFDHDATRFPLTGRHRTALCGACHTNNQFAALPTDCYSCHRLNYLGAKNPDHVAKNFSQACQTCHSTTGWDPAFFDHATTAFPLSGAHLSQACISCHTGNNYTLQYVDCYQCHRPNYEGTTSPDHVGGAFPHDCGMCHSTSVWQPSNFNHASTAFPLSGMHGLIGCESCHKNGNYTTLQYSSCYQCHQTDYEGATVPDHLGGAFPHDCATCHSTAAWSPSSFNHAATAFPLTGMHGLIGCESCHKNGNYTTLQYINCYQCHQTDFEGTTSPNHVTQNFSHDCLQCHTTAGWTPSTFNHSTTAFALSGAHVPAACVSCHASGNYQLTYTDCYQCHQAQYQVPTDPNHVTANFDHRCQTCHTTSAWLPSTFNHDLQAFRINSGRHFQQWSACADCHTNAANYAQFSCFNCHAQPTMDAAHSQVTGYSYSSPACYSCHRNV